MVVDKINYSFDDEVITKFSYDANINQIEIRFEGYYANGNYIESPCSLIIENWKEAKSRLHGTKFYDSLEKNLRIFSMILHMESSLDELKLSINTVDDSYLELLFKKPKIRIRSSI